MVKGASGGRPDAARLTAWRTFIQAHAAVVRRLGRELEESQELPLTWYEVLLRLGEAEGGRLRLHDLAHVILITRSGVSRLIDRMQAVGLVRRETCPSDRRGAYAVLTSQGRAALRRADAVYVRGIEKHFSGLLSGAEAEALTTGLSRIAGALEEDGQVDAGRSGCPSPPAPR